MKKRLKDIILQAKNVAASHHDMSVDAVALELGLLRDRLDHEESKLIPIENEVMELSELLEEGHKAVSAVSDAYESHSHGKTI